MATPTFNENITPDDNVRALIEEQSESGATAALPNGWQPFPVLVAKAVFNAEQKAEAAGEGGNADTLDGFTPATLPVSTATQAELDVLEAGQAPATEDSYGTVNSPSRLSVRIGAWGDSLTAGSGSTTGGYPQYFGNLNGLYVYNGGVGGETSTQIRTRMVAATDKADYTTIIWAGRNNYASGSTVQSDIAAMVAALGHDRYLILSILNSSAEPSGNANYNLIVALNAALASTYGAKFVDVRDYLINDALAALGITPTAQDVIDIGNDVVPDSLRSDEIHLNNDGYQAVVLKLNEVGLPRMEIADAIGGALAAYTEIGGRVAGIFRTSNLYIGAKNITNSGDGNFSVGGVLYPSATRTQGLGAGAAVWGSMHAQDVQVYTSTGTSAGGGMQINSSANAEKWRVGLRGMTSGTEGNNLIFGYFDGTSRTNTFVFGSNGTLTATAFSGSGSGITGIVGTGVANTPEGNIAATSVQSAINELDTEKAGLSLANTFIQNQAISLSGAAVLTITGTTESNITMRDSGFTSGSQTVNLNVNGGVLSVRRMNDAANSVTSTPMILDIATGNLRLTGSLGVGNSAAATTLGTVTRKMEVFNATGTSLGFVAVYDAIT
jgi:lysophospholipase L1-like esterase